MVDSVSDVLTPDADSSKPATTINSSVGAGCITGIGCVEVGNAVRMLILTDIETLMGRVGTVLLDEAAHCADARVPA